MKNTHYKQVFIILALLATSASISAKSYDFDSEKIEILQQTCPAVVSLTQDPVKKTWHAPGEWRSFNPSFFRTLEHFVGAQWVGVSVGNVICSYARQGRPDFSVHLQRNTVVPSPVGGSWSEDKGGYKDCFSSDIEQCAYSVITPTQPKDVYEQIDFYKTQPPQTQNTR